MLKCEGWLTLASLPFESFVFPKCFIAANILPRKGCLHLSSCWWGNWGTGQKRLHLRSVAKLECEVQLPALASKGHHVGGLLQLCHLRTPQKKASGHRAGSEMLGKTAHQGRQAWALDLTFSSSLPKSNCASSCNLSQHVLTAYTWTDSFNFSLFLKLKK